MEEQRRAVQRMQDYIQGHPDEAITLSDLARVSCFSPWHAHRLFTALTGRTPADYIRRLRLSRSALRLRDEAIRITDAALDAGFDSVEGYQRAFLRTFGCNPGDYARHPVPIGLFIPYGVQFQTPRKETAMSNFKPIYLQLIQRPARALLFKRGVKADHYFAYCEEVGCDVWGLLSSVESLCGEPTGLWLPPALVRPGTSTYVQGVEIGLEEVVDVPAGFDLLPLPAALYLRFQGPPFEEADYETAIQEVWAAIERYDPAAIGYAWDETQPRMQLEPVGARGYIELRPVRPLAGKDR